jgi:hypothetical protein
MKRLHPTLVALAVLGVSARSAAFCRTTTCDPGASCASDPAACCMVDAQGCDTNGIPLFWPTPCVSFGVQRDGSPLRDISFDLADDIVSESFSTWLDADCNPGNPSLNIQNVGPLICHEAEYNQTQPNANIWLFRDQSWPYVGDFATLALTTITFNYETGEIFDADVEVNSHEVPLSTSDTDVEFDLASIVTHEAGHFLGLSHSFEAGATMQPGYRQGLTALRTLEADDVAGICAAYPPDRTLPSGDCTPRHGFSSECPMEDDGGGCAFGGPAVPLSAGAWLAAAALAFGWTRRRRMRA